MAKVGGDVLVVGFDLGHGETSVTLAAADKTTPPSVLEIGSADGRQQITAVAEHPGRGVLVGAEAVEARGVTSLFLGFKSPELDREDVSVPVGLFVTAIRDYLVEHSLVPNKGNVKWVFGAPSGWSADLRRQYAKLLKSTGLLDVEVTAESRAALLYGRDAGEIQLDGGKLGGVVLIVDIGSSTTDFTSVTGHKDRPIDQGTQLGASLIDKTILDRALRNHADRDRLEEALHVDRFLRLRLELECRRLKERFFRTDPTRFVADPTERVEGYKKVDTPGGAIHFHVELGPQDMDAVLDSGQPALDGQSWRQKFEGDLRHVLEVIGRPDAVLLTGGASRMRFTLDLAREVFGNDRVVMGAEPEVAIARGLALAGRMTVLAAGFRADVQRFLESDSITSLVTDRLPALASEVGKAAASGMTDRHVVPVFRQWREGDIRTLNDMANRIVSRVEAELATADNPKLTQVVVDWQNKLRPDLEELTRPICVRWHIPPSAMALPELKLRGNRVDVSINSAAARDVVKTLTNVINVVIAGLVTTILLAHTAILAVTGPIGIIAGVIGVLAYGKEAKQKAVDKAMVSNMPAWMRKAKSEEKMIAKLRSEAAQQEAQMTRQLSDGFLKTGGPELVKTLSQAIAKELDVLASEAELLIS